MKLVIESFANAGDLDKERVVLRANDSLEIGDYALLASLVGSENVPMSGFKRCYWFPNGEVKSGDLVVVYTKKGQRSTKALNEAHTAHFYYWGLDEPQYEPDKAGVVLLEAPEWQFEFPQSVPEAP